MCRDASIPYFKINPAIFCCLLFFEECINPQVRINKMVNEHTLDYHPSLSELTSKINLLIFLSTPNGFISSEYFLYFFSIPYVPPWFQKSFKSMVLRLLANTFVSQKIESVHYSCHQAQLSPMFFSLSPKQKELNQFYQTAFPENLCFLQQKGEEDYEAEKMTKIKPAKVLVTNFDKFHHLCHLFCFEMI